ncbi:DUF2652 domain-containing protein [Maribacter litoralis]|uniref:DUF2652 domain-containing protein n=1 Tax=Maribacter litoralis TaxID=2059726 RepID=UPI003F5CD29F
MKKSSEGIIFIVDISGYSKFVKEIDNEIGAIVISDLLHTIIKANYLSFRISEIEGDAILFYKLDHIYPVGKILLQFEVMLKAFNKRINYYKDLYHYVNTLSLKLVVHYGTIGKFSINGFNKLFGKTLVEAHRLLKNSIPYKTYTLITKTYQEKLKQLELDSSKYIDTVQHYDQYDIGKLHYSFYPFKDSKYKIENTLAIA